MGKQKIEYRHKLCKNYIMYIKLKIRSLHVETDQLRLIVENRPTECVKLKKSAVHVKCSGYVVFWLNCLWTKLLTLFFKMNINGDFHFNKKKSINYSLPVYFSILNIQNDLVTNSLECYYCFLKVLYSYTNIYHLM